MNTNTYLQDGRIQINIDGPAGNAFMLLGYAKRLCKDLGYTSEETEAMQNAMMSSDYQNLLQVFNNHFDSIVNLYHGNVELVD